MTEVITLVAGPELTGRQRSVVQALHAVPAPALDGLLARHWRLFHRHLQGRYLLGTPEQAGDFTERLDDPALVLVQSLFPGSSFEVAAHERIRTASVRLDRPIFVISAPRAGSTLLAETLSLASGLWSLDAEGHGVVEGIRALHPATRGYTSQRLDQDDVTPEVLTSMTAGYLAELQDHDGRRWLEYPDDERPAAPRMLDKTPEHVLRIPFLRAVFPDARFLLLHREIRPNVSSILAAWSHPGFTSILDLPGWSHQRWCFLLPEGWRTLDGAPLSDVAAYQWRRANEQALDDLMSIPEDCWTSLGYEELTTGPARAVRRVCDDLQLEVGPRLAARLSRPLPLSATTTTPPSPVKWRSNPDLLASSLRGLGHVAGRLRALDSGTAALAAPARPTNPPRLEFACLLHQLEPAPVPAHGLRPNPTLRVQVGTSPPVGLVRRTRFRERFLPGHPLLWVENPLTGALDPFWARPQDIGWLRELEAGRVPDVAPLGTGQLLRAGVLQAADGSDQPPTSPPDDVLESAREAFAVDCYARLPRLLHSDQRHAYAAYYRALVASGRWNMGDGQVTRRHGWHDEPMARFLHHQLTPFVSRVAGEPVKATYCYSSAYHGGAALPAHVDREQCEFTMSLLLDQSAELAHDPWALWFAAPSGHRRVVLNPGEAVLFRGCDLPHWRDAAPAEHEQTMLLFHYVSAGFAGPLD